MHNAISARTAGMMMSKRKSLGPMGITHCRTTGFQPAQTARTGWKPVVRDDQSLLVDSCRQAWWAEDVQDGRVLQRERRMWDVARQVQHLAAADDDVLPLRAAFRADTEAHSAAQHVGELLVIVRVGL